MQQHHKKPCAAFSTEILCQNGDFQFCQNGKIFNKQIALEVARCRLVSRYIKLLLTLQRKHHLLHAALRNRQPRSRGALCSARWSSAPDGVRGCLGAGPVPGRQRAPRSAGAQPRPRRVLQECGRCCETGIEWLGW